MTATDAHTTTGERDRQDVAAAAGAARPGRLRRWWPRRPYRNRVIDRLVAAGYLLAALYVMGHLLIDPNGRVQLNNRNDSAFFRFVLAHGARVVFHGQNPFFTRQMNMPDGVNMMANTSLLGLTLPLAPVTQLFGAPVAYLVLLVLVLAATAISWYALLIRHVVRSRFAAFVGGWVCGFGPSTVAQANGHPNIVAQFLVPWIIWRAIKMREPGRLLRNAVILAALVVWQFFINEEVLLLTGMGLGLVGLVHVIWHRRAALPEALRFLRGVTVAAAITFLVVAYPLWFQFFGPQHYRGLPPLVQAYGVDLWSYFSFASESVSGNSNAGALFAANPAEQNGFLAWGLILLLGGIVWQLRRSSLVIGLAVAGVTFVLLSPGDKIVIRGHHLNVYGPWALLSKLPLFDTVVATRLGLAVTPIAALLLALGCDRFIAWTATLRAEPAAEGSPAERQSADADGEAAPESADEKPAEEPAGANPTPLGRRFRLAGAALLAVALVPIAPTPLPAVGQPIPAFISHGTYRQYVPPGRSLVTVPLPRPPFMDALFFDAATLDNFAFPRGYFLGPGVDSKHPDQLGSMYGAPFRPTSTLLEGVAFTGRVPAIGPVDRAAAVEDLTYWRAAVIILPFGANREFELYQATSDLVGFAPRPVDGVWLWDVRSLVPPPG
jgi:hypothetical protein